MTNRRRQPRAFTLLELIVATGMTAVLAGSLYATLHVAFKARQSAFAAVEQVRKAELAAELLRADIQSAVVPSGILAGTFLGESAANASGLPSDALVLHCVADGTQEMRITGDIRMVEFACEPDPDSEGMVLLRRVTVNLLSTKVSEPVEEVLCRDVRSFDLAYFDGTDWQDNWDSGMHGNALPLAVEVTLELVGPYGVSTDEGGYLLRRLFQVPCSSIAPGLQVELGAM